MNTTFSSRTFPLSIALAVIATASTVLGGCNDSATTAIVENGYSVAEDAGVGRGSMTVFKAWWVTTLFPSPVAEGKASAAARTIPGSDFAYALLAPGWSVESGKSPDRLVAVRSRRKLVATDHNLLRIVVSDQEFVGNCAAGDALGTEDARLVSERIFPGDFANVTYDPATCTSTPLNPDASTADGSGGSSDGSGGTTAGDAAAD